MPFSTATDLKSFIVRDPIVVSSDAAAIDAIATMHLARADPGGEPLLGEAETPNSPVDNHRQIRSSCALVIRDRQYAGILTAQDVVRLCAQQHDLAHVTVGQVMSTAVGGLRESALTDLSSMMNIIQQRCVTHLPILNEWSYPIGLVTNESLQPALSRELQAQRQIEALLLESEQRYASLAAIAPVGIFRTDSMGRCTYVNDRYCKITGATPDAILGAAWRDYVYPADRDTVVASWEQFVKNSLPFHLECRLCRPDGTVVWVYSQAMVEHNAAGHAVGCVGALTDISDRKRAEIALRQRESQSRALLTAIPDYLVRVGADGVYREIVTPNPELTVVPGAVNAVGSTLQEILPEHIAARQYHYLKQALETGELQRFEQQLQVGDRRQDEEVRMIKSGEDEVLLMIRDISERKQTEAALKQSEWTNSTLINTMPDLLIHMDRRGHYSRVAGGSTVRVKQPSDDCAERNVYTVLTPELAQQRLYYANQAIDSGTVQVYEQLFDYDGDLRHEEVRIAPLNQEEVLVIVRDVSERKQADLQLQSLFEGTAATTGQDFFPALTRHIAQALNVSHAGVTEQIGDELRILAFWTNGGLQPCSSFNATNLPCGRTLRDGSFYFEGLIKQEFAEAEPMSWGDLTTYLGVALTDNAGQAIGTLFIMNEHPIQDLQRASQILHIFAARAAAELERQTASLSLEQLNQQLEAKVTERTAALQEREQFLQTVLDTFPLSVFWKDCGSVYLGGNRNFLRDANLTSVSELFGKTDRDMPWANCNEDCARDQEIVESNIAKLGTVEARTHADGSQVWIETNKLPLHNLNGDVIGVLGTYQDITDRKRAEQDLQESQHFIQTVLDTLPIPVNWKDRNSVYLGCNQQLATVLGFESPAEIAGKTDFDVVVDRDEAEQFRADDRQVMESGIPRLGIEEPLTLPDGDQHWLMTNKAPLRDLAGNVFGVVVTIQDITDRKQAETQVHDLLSRTQLLNHISSEIRDSLDVCTIIQSAINVIVAELPADICAFAWYEESSNTEAYSGQWTVKRECKVDGLSSSLGTYSFNQFPQLISHIVDNQVYRVDGLTDLPDEPLTAYLNQIGISAFLCIPIHTGGEKTGSLQVGRMAGSRPWQNGEIELLQAIANQVAIAIYQAELYKESQAKTEQLRRSYQDLEEAQRHMVQSEKMSSLGQIVAGVAHEINNPVGFIYGNMAVASDYANSLTALIKLYQQHYPDPPEAIAHLAERVDTAYILNDFPKLLASVENGANRIQNIVQSLRTFSRLERAESSEVDIHRHIDNTLVLLQNRLNGRAGNPEIQVVKHYGGLPPIECYSGLLDQVFMNLLSNAVDAVEEQQENAGTTYRGRITIATAIAIDSTVTISIQDNGSGMSPETQAKIFNPFFTTKPIGAGTGMGLSISYQIVTASHKGKLHCHSFLSSGTEFVIELAQRLPS
ncbi:MAG: PAS domain-containing protein [Elainellaceae cyanobacterium]